jgi:hypothetical protein
MITSGQYFEPILVPRDEKIDFQFDNRTARGLGSRDVKFPLRLFARSGAKMASAEQIIAGAPTPMLGSPRLPNS